MTVAVLGPGAVGGALAARVASSGHRVICVASARAAEAIHERGLTLSWLDLMFATRPEAVERLIEPVDLLLVTVKARDLDRALDRIQEEAAIVLPLMNGLEHPAVLRRRLGRRVVAGSIRIEAVCPEPAFVVQQSPFTVVRLASDDLPRERLEPVAALLQAAQIETHVDASEKAVLWEKAARLAALAPATAIAQRPVGELRADPEWRPRLEAAIAEACDVATADGAPTAPAEQWAIIDSLPEALTTSAARDIAAGRPSELDAITGAVVRAGRRLGVLTPALDELLERCRRQ
jgi:2-dehydropantoate 2-reductase